ncbi:MAG TPA: PTS sugar transporter subunit IIA [Gemmataceae bacterium]|jgi:PTS system nitrogen regulatory IIA component|nr:PTS sugar transporter subunit IIA [Gemmataceae bacterium]
MDTMNLQELASLLGRDARELGKLANRGHLPGRKVGGEWRFSKAEIHRWLEQEMNRLSDQELRNLEPATRDDDFAPVLSSLLPIECIELSFPARTRNSALRELVKLAERSHRVWDPEAILEAIIVREENGGTAHPEGFAIPHPHRRIPNTLGESVLAFGRTASGIPFGSPHGTLTDLFFLLCCTEDRLHLRALARLALVLRQDSTRAQLRAAQTPAEVLEILDETERRLA